MLFMIALIIIAAIIGLVLGFILGFALGFGSGVVSAENPTFYAPPSGLNHPARIMVMPPM
jgi:hypothetical protein